MAKWVSVEERLPVETGLYFILIGFDENDLHKAIGNFYDGKEDWQPKRTDHGFRKEFGHQSVFYWLDGIPELPQE